MTNNNNSNNANANNALEMDMDLGSDGKINPLAGMGLSDADYHAILRGMIDGDALAGLAPNFALVAASASARRAVKRERGGGGMGGDGEEDEDEDMEERGRGGREGKRSRFEEIVDSSS